MRVCGKGLLICIKGRPGMSEMLRLRKSLVDFCCCLCFRYQDDDARDAAETPFGCSGCSVFFYFCVASEKGTTATKKKEEKQKRNVNLCCQMILTRWDFVYFDTFILMFDKFR